MDANKPLPKDAQVMAAILKDMGINDYEPRVINHMLEFTYRYVTDVLEDSRVYSEHAGKKEIDVEDVKLAVQCKLDHSFTTPPPKSLLLEIAKQKNSTPLPTIKPYTGPKLPPDRYCLASTNYRLRSFKKPKVNQHIVSSIQAPARMGAIPLSNTPQMITVRSTPMSSTPAATTPQQPMYRLTPQGQSFQSTFAAGIKPKLDDDYDAV